MKIPSSKKLWRIIQEPAGYFYEIRYNGVVIDRFPVSKKVLDIFVKKGEVK